MGDHVTLSLISHTNVGKTTLARTLLRRDVGEVLDQAHVTEVSTVYELISTPEAELRLWDTPGFGDSMRLLSRLRRKEQPVLWFLQQAWDRVTDRPLWSSQQAALNIREEADVVLYLVNASEEPEEAGYVIPELELLNWLGRPILLLLNQTGAGLATPELLAERVELWKRHTARFDLVHDVQVLDAFSRCWVQESGLLARVEKALPEEQREVMATLREAWDRRNLGIFDRAVQAMARYLGEAATDREPLEGKWSLADSLRKVEKTRAMERLAARLETLTGEHLQALLALHGLEGKVAEAIDRQLVAFEVEGDLLNPEKGALWGSVLSGAMGGLAADAMSGGFSLGGGMLAGAILGALGGAGLARGYQMVKGERPSVRWSPEFLHQLAARTLLRYLAVAHFGRGRGEFRQDEASVRWRTAVGRVVRRHAEEFEEVWKKAVWEEEPRNVRRRLEEVLDHATRRLLVEGYPNAADLLRQTS